MAAVDMVSPTGNKEVVSENAVQAKLAQGYVLLDDAWKTQQEAIAAQKRQEWLADPATVDERFRMLRTARDAKLAAHDSKIAQLQREARLGVDVAAYIAAWDTYAQALCKLPEQAGAPWDGGGQLTPWPVQPE